MNIIPSDWNKIKQINIQKFADCPWPITGSQCSLCTVWLSDDKQLGFNIWGEYDEDESRKRFYAQPFCVEAKLKRFVYKVARTQPSDVPENDGLYIGIVDIDTLNNQSALYDPSQWEWAGYISTVQGGTPTEHQYFCIDIDRDLDTTKQWYLLMMTNGSYETCGWQMSGFGDPNFPEGVQTLWEYSYNEPGNPNGWTMMDNYFRGCVIPYTEGIGALSEPSTSIINESFPITAQEGTPWVYSFTQVNPKAFPCGCPSTLYYKILDRDTNEEIVPRTTYSLDCGYTGKNWDGSINFIGSGTFHGRVEIGHHKDGNWPVDDTHDFDVTITTTPCSDYTNQTDCINAGCYWCDGQCQSTPCEGEVYLYKAITCATAGPNCGDEGPQKTTFEKNETIYAYTHFKPTDGFDFYGHTVRHEWWHNEEKKWEYEWTCDEHYTNNWCQWTNWAIGQTHGPGTGYILVFFDEIYMGKTNDYTVQGIDVIGNIDFINSTFYTGPFNPGSTETIAYLTFKNSGTEDGAIYIKIYENPNTLQETEIYDGNFHLQGGQTITDLQINVTIPTNGAWPLGIKVWGEGENEPTW